MKKLLLAVGWLLIAVPALVVFLTIYGVSKFIGQENEMPPEIRPEHKPTVTPAALDCANEACSSEQSESPSSLAVAGLT